MRIIINPIGGLANRMRAIASGISICDKLSITPEIVWPMNNDLNCSFEKLFVPDTNNFKLSNISGLNDLFVYDEPRKKNLYLSKFFHKKNHFNLIITDKTITKYYNEDCELLYELIKSFDSTVLIRSGLNYYDFSSKLYKSLFKPTKEVMEIANNTIINLPSKNIIGIHIRRTDNKISIEQSPITLFKNKIDENLRIDSNVCFYLATDSEDIKHELKHEYGNIIISSSKIASRKTESGIIEALAEMIILSKCKMLYGSYWSSFSEAASLLGDTPIEILQKTIVS